MDNERKFDPAIFHEFYRVFLRKLEVDLIGRHHSFAKDNNDIYLENKSWLIPVPAAAVIREGRALFGLIGRKGHVGCFKS